MAVGFRCAKAYAFEAGFIKCLLHKPKRPEFRSHHPHQAASNSCFKRSETLFCLLRVLKGIHTHTHTWGGGTGELNFKCCKL